MTNRYWVDLRTSGVSVVDSFVKDLDSPKPIVKKWDACYDECCKVYYVPLEFEIEANKLCKKLNEEYNSQI